MVGKLSLVRSATCVPRDLPASRNDVDERAQPFRMHSDVFLLGPLFMTCPPRLVCPDQRVARCLSSPML